MFVFIPLIISQLASWRCPCTRIYIGGSGIVEVIEKLSCRSGWFVESGQVLIHSAASLHKNIKQGIPEERRQRQEWWGETERQSEAERERNWTHKTHQQQSTRAKNGGWNRIQREIKFGEVWHIRRLTKQHNNLHCRRLRSYICVNKAEWKSLILLVSVFFCLSITSGLVFSLHRCSGELQEQLLG